VILQEVGEESKLTRSFERIRSIVNKNRLKKDLGGGNVKDEKSMKLEMMVQCMMKQKVANQMAIKRIEGQLQETVNPMQNIQVLTYSALQVFA